MERGGYIGWTRRNSEISTEGNPFLLQSVHYFGGAALGAAVGVILWLAGAQSSAAIWKGTILGVVGGAALAVLVLIEAGVHRWRVRRHRRRRL